MTRFSRALSRATALSGPHAPSGTFARQMNELASRGRVAAGRVIPSRMTNIPPIDASANRTTTYNPRRSGPVRRRRLREPDPEPAREPAVEVFEDFEDLDDDALAPEPDFELGFELGFDADADVGPDRDRRLGALVDT